MPNDIDASATPAAEPADAARAERRRKRTLTAVFVAVLLIAAAALGYATIRDPGPLPPVPPDISGTDDGALKRAIVHYVGAVADEDPDELVDLIGMDDARTRALAQLVIDEFASTARKKATVEVERTDDADARTVTITYADGRTQVVDYFKPADDEPWRPMPQITADLPEPTPSD